MSGEGIDLVIFDCDGVLVDSEPISVDVLREMIVEAGGDIGEDEAYRLFLGRSTASVAQILIDDFGLKLTQDHLDTMRQRLFERFRAELRPVPGIGEALSHIAGAKCVASSSQPDRIRLSLGLTGLLESFEPHIFSSTMVANGKPAPDLFLHVASSMGVDPSRCVVVEDSPAGVEAGKRAGMHVLAYVGGSHAVPGELRKTIAALEPDAVFDNMGSLPRLIAEASGIDRSAAATTSRRADSTGPFVCAVDVGTLSARAGLFDAAGEMLSRVEAPIELLHPRDGHAEHDSEDIWRAVCAAVRGACADADPARISGIAFDATCSLVVRDPRGAPLSVSTAGKKRLDTISWIDHRAMAEADELTATGHHVLDYVGGVMSPEMQTPKLLWLKRNMPETWQAAGQFFDLADFLSWRATGSTARSQCTLTAKWTYLAHEGGWSQEFLDVAGLGDLLERGGLPQSVNPAGARIGTLTKAAAKELGLAPDCVVATGVIDAFAGALGTIGALPDGSLERQAALIAGTSSCVMGMAGSADPTPGVWGPYLGAALPGKWLWEGGQSATGALLDHVIRLFGDGHQPDPQTHRDIIARIGELRATEGETFAAGIEVLPDFHGNRSPLANPHARGIITGLTLDHSFDNLCRIYWRTAVAIALGVRQIIDHMKVHGREIETLHVIGGHRSNPLLMELYAEATGVGVTEPACEDAVLLGTAMLAAAGAGIHPDLPAACAAMASPGSLRPPRPEMARAYDRDYETFKRLQAFASG